MTPKLLMLGLLAAILLFWAIGAHNRLVRLRAAAGRAFAALDAVLSVQPALIQAALPTDSAPGSTDDAPDDTVAPWLRLSAAGEQYASALARARAQPLDPEAISALSEAQRVLDDTWDNADDPGASLPDSLLQRLVRLADQAQAPRLAFDATITTYNDAVRQFPALLLARLWGFKPAGFMDTPAPG